MPRLPVDGKKVVEYRITLGQKERDMVDTLITGITVKNVSNPIVSILKDNTALVALYVFLVALYPKWAKDLGLPDDWAEITEPMNPSQIAEYAQNNVDYLEGGGPIGAGLGALIGRYFGHPYAGAAAGAVVGEEVLEPGVEYLTQPGDGIGQGIGTVFIANLLLLGHQAWNKVS